MSDSLWPHALQPARFLCPWDSPGKNTGVGCHFLLQGIFLTQGSNPGLLHCRKILYHLSYMQILSSTHQNNNDNIHNILWFIKVLYTFSHLNTFSHQPWKKQVKTAFTSIKSSFTLRSCSYDNSVNPHDIPIVEVAIFAPVYRWGNWGKPQKKWQISDSNSSFWLYTLISSNIKK